jgi:hypothetical protein
MGSSQSTPSTTGTAPNDVSNASSGPRQGGITSDEKVAGDIALLMSMEKEMGGRSRDLSREEVHRILTQAYEQGGQDKENELKTQVDLYLRNKQMELTRKHSGQMQSSKDKVKEHIESMDLTRYVPLGEKMDITEHVCYGKQQEVLRCLNESNDTRWTACYEPFKAFIDCTAKKTGNQSQNQA